jgi:hypothetical protein
MKYFMHVTRKCTNYIWIIIFRISYKITKIVGRNSEMKRFRGIGILFAVALAAQATLIAGCGGGGGGSTSHAAATRGRLNMHVEIPRGTESVADLSASIDVLAYDAVGSPDIVANTATTLTYNETTGKYTGSFFIDQIPAGSNYVCRVKLFYGAAGVQSVDVVKGKSSITTKYVGALVDTISDGGTEDVTINATSTVKALAAVAYAKHREVPLSNTTVVSTSVKNEISITVDSMLESRSILTGSFVDYADGDPFVPSEWTEDLATKLNSVLVEADLMSELGAATGNIAVSGIQLYNTANVSLGSYSQAVSVSGITVALDGTDFTALTDSGGNFSFSDLPMGSYRVKIGALYGTQFTVGAEATTVIPSFNYCTSMTRSADTVTPLVISGVHTYPNPTSDAVTTQFAAASAASTGSFLNNAYLYDLSGTLVWSGDTTVPDLASVLENGAYTLAQWDGTATAGGALADGVYAYIVHASDDTYADDAAGCLVVSSGMDFVSPQVDSILPADSATDVARDGFEVKIVFSETMDNSIIMDGASLAASGIGITITPRGGGTAFAIDGSNASTYGTFSWTTTNVTNDTLKFTLVYDSLDPGVTYDLTVDVPTNAADPAGNAVDTTGSPFSSAFTTGHNNIGWVYPNASVSDVAMSIVQTTSGGYAFAGYTGSSDSNLLVTKIDANGDQVWTSSLGDTGKDDSATSIIETSDGGLIVTGYTETYGAGGRDVWVIKLSSSGTVQWSQTYGGTGDSVASSIREITGGSFVLAGSTDSYGGGGTDAWVLKIVSTGNEEWANTFGGTGADSAKSAIETTDGGFIMVGTTSSSGAGGNDIWVVKLDSAGVEEWNQTYGTSDDESGVQIAETGGGYLILGTSYNASSGYDTIVLNIDSAGGVLDQSTIGDGEDTGYSMTLTDDGGYIVSGHAVRSGNNGAWLYKSDSGGTMEWEVVDGTDNANDIWESVIQTLDSGYAVAGLTKVYGGAEGDVWVVKFDTGGVPEWYQ